MKNYVYWIVGLLICAIVLLWWVFINRPVSTDQEATAQEIMVYFAKSEPTQIVTVGVKREIPLTDNDGLTLQKTMEQLLAGPNQDEKNQGLITVINSGTKLNYIKLDKKIATVDFNDQFDFQMGGSARVLAIREQLEKTVLQFDFVDQLVLTVNNGEREANLEP